MPVILPRDLPPATEHELRETVSPGRLQFSLSCFMAALLMDTFLCAIFMMQSYQYWSVHSSDRWWIKMIVVAVTFLGLFTTGFMWHFGHHMFVEGFGKYTHIFGDPTFLPWYPLFDAITAGFTQFFFAYRAFRLTRRNYYILLSVILLIAVGFAASAATKATFGRMQSSQDAGKTQATILIWCVSSMVADLIITTAILYGLITSRTGWIHTDRVITRLIRLTLESQTPPLIVAIVYMIGFLIAPTSVFCSTLMAIQNKMYTVGLFYSLNARETFATRNVTMDFTGSNYPQQTKSQPAATVHVDVETETYETRVELPRPGLNRMQSGLVARSKALDRIDDSEEETDTTANGSARGSKVHLSSDGSPPNSPRS